MTDHACDCTDDTTCSECMDMAAHAITLPTAMTVDQLEDAKLGRALREAAGAFAIIHLARDDEEWHATTEGWNTEGSVPYIEHGYGTGHTLLAALTAARRELDDRS